MIKFCIVYDLQAERSKRTNLYSQMSMPFLMEAMVDFLEANPMPIASKSVLRDGIDLFESIKKLAITNEMKQIARDYTKLFKDTISSA